MAYTLILPFALAALMAGAKRSAGFRDGFLRALVCFGGVLAVLTELLGAAHALRRGPVFVAWCTITILALRVAQKRGIGKFNPAPAHSGMVDWLALAGIAAILAITLLAALLSPPNSADAMAYHLPRVVYWAQAASVAFFPTSYFNQTTLQPLAEYFVLHAYVLSGGDHFANLVQWLGSAGSVVGVSAIAAAYGASVRAQVMAALFCATLPNGILQATGAKNDYLLAMWLVAMSYFARRYATAWDNQDLIATGLSLALAVFTKATAYLFAPAMLTGIWLPVVWSGRKRIAAVALVLFTSVIVVNGPQYWRNFDLAGSPLGYDSAQGDGFYRWQNRPFGWRQTVSNLLRHGADQLGSAKVSWNQGVYRAVVRGHAWIGIDVNDPSTTWPGTKFEPPRNANHEANAHNRWHLLLFILAGTILLVGAARNPSWYACGIVVSFLLFCFYLKWQPFMARMVLPLFVLASPVPAAWIGRWKWAFAHAALVLFLVNNTRPFLFENWVRPLKGPMSLWRTARDDNYFNDMAQWGDQRSSYRTAVDLVVADGCKGVGIDTSHFQLEYPFQALLRERVPEARFVHVGVKNVSLRYAAVPLERPCAIMCLLCRGLPEKSSEYSEFQRTVETGQSLVFLSRH